MCQHVLVIAKKKIDMYKGSFKSKVPNFFLPNEAMLKVPIILSSADTSVQDAATQQLMYS